MRRQRAPAWPARVLLAALLVALAGCGTPSSRLATDAAGKAPLTVWVGPTTSLHPHATNPHVTAALFAPLVAVDPVTHLPAWGDRAPTALLQELRSSDLQRWDLEIKEGWTWHDGTEVTAADLARGWTAAADAGLPITSTVADVQVRDKTTLSMALTAPYGQLPALLADPAFLPLPVLAEEDPTRFADAPVGNGPFRLAGRDADTLLLEAHDGPQVPALGLSRVALARTATPDPGDEVVALPDGVLGTPRGGDRPGEVTGPGRLLAYVGLPLTDPRYADVEVRRALSMALDRSALVALLDGPAVPADRLLGPGMARADGVSCDACQHDPDAAAALWPAPLEGPLTIWFATDADHEPVVDALAESWSTVLGVDDIQLASLPAPDLIDRLQQAEVSGPFRLSWAADVPSPSRLLEPLFGPRGAGNDFRFRSDAVADLLAEADAAAASAEALDTYGQVEAAVLDEMPLIPLWFSTVRVLIAADVSVALDGMGRLDWTALRQDR